MDEIEVGVLGCWQSINPEMSTKQMAINREHRIRALNKNIGDPVVFPWANWSDPQCFDVSGGTLCLCGNTITKATKLRHTNGDNILLGSECIRRVEHQYVGTEHAAAASKFVSQLDCCSDCGNPKVKSYQYCGDDICVRCDHGLRKYYKGISKSSGKPFAAWFCTCNGEDCCKPIFVKADKKKAIIRQ
jgi:hypothetical protein